MTHRCRHVEAIRPALEERHAENITVERDGDRVNIRFDAFGKHCRLVASAHPRDPVNAENVLRQAMHRAFREARAS